LRGHAAALCGQWTRWATSPCLKLGSVSLGQSLTGGRRTPYLRRRVAAGCRGPTSRGPGKTPCNGLERVTTTNEFQVSRFRIKVLVKRPTLRPGRPPHLVHCPAVSTCPARRRHPRAPLRAGRRRRALHEPRPTRRCYLTGLGWAPCTRRGVRFSKALSWTSPGRKGVSTTTIGAHPTFRKFESRPMRSPPGDGNRLRVPCPDNGVNRPVRLDYGGSADDHRLWSQRRRRDGAS
jgi:hypothetical protein